MQQKLLDGRYEITGFLGSGGMSKVYLAHDEVLGRDVALKVLREQYAEDEGFVERFRREAQAAASLSHPNIVATYDRGCSEGGSYYIVMEYVPGGTLKDRVARRGPLEPYRAAGLAAQIAGALGAAHDRGVIHRDVKPHNVLLTATGDAKVTDFGIARAASESSLSGTSMILGTVNYMSPEQAMGGVVGPRSDLYSLGVVLHEMLAGKMPFEAETPMAVTMKHVNEPAPSLSETNPDVPEGLNAIRAKLLAKNPEDRYASASEVAEDLRRVRRGQEPLLASPVLAAPDAPTGVLPRPGVARNRRRRWRPFLLRTTVALAGVSGLVGVFGWGLSDSQGRQPEGVIEEARQIVAREAEVSDVLGLERAEAQQRLVGEGFEVDVRFGESSEGDDGRVIAQSIPGGEEAEKGAKVVLDIGEGPDPVPAPELAGLSLAAAEDVLAEAGLEVGERTEEPSETVPEGDVIRQTPPAGERVEPGTPVDLVVSTGPAEPAPAPEPPAEPAAEPPPAAEASEPPVAPPPAAESPKPATEPAAEPPSAAEAPAEPAVPPAEPAPELPVEPAPAPVVESAPEPAPEQYAPVPQQYEPAAPAAQPAPAEPAPAAPVEQYDAPAAQSPEEFVESQVPGVDVPEVAPAPQGSADYEGGGYEDGGGVFEEAED